MAATLSPLLSICLPPTSEKFPFEFPYTSIIMITRKTLSCASALYIISFLFPPALCHMQMSWPYPLRSSFNPANSYEDIDYSMTSPLNSDGSNFPCKGYQNDRPIQMTVTYAAGSTYNMTLAGDTMHGGGSCQLSLSYDNGATFRVIKSMIGGCPLISTYDFTIPSYAPTGTALLAWTWQNLIGNREYYMNCAEVNIISGLPRRRWRQTFTSFDQLPYIWKANLEGINNCVTVEGDHPIYPHPGPDVAYGDGMSSSSAPSPGDCDEPTPYGQTYENLGDTGAAPSPIDQPGGALYGASSSDASTSATGESSPDAAPTSYHQPLDPDANQRGAADPSLSPSTTTITANCLSTVTTAVYPSASGTTTVITTPSTVVLTSTYTVQPVPSTSSTSSGHPLYATGDVERYLPCVPGTYLCTSNTTWKTCDYNDGSDTNEPSASWVYDYPRNVSAGMECIGFYSPYSNETSQYAQQAMAPDGYYRDDRIVRARPDGDCDDEGSIQCTGGGQMFDVCDQGGWVQMGVVANGTVCENGEIVVS